MSISKPVVGVASRSFSRHPILRAELLERFPGAKFNDAGVSLAGSGLADFLQGCERAVLALERVDDTLLRSLPGLRVISKYGVGLDGIDLQALDAHGVALGWTPGVNRRSVAELVIAYAIGLLHRVPAAVSEVRAGTWRQVIGRQLTGRVVGVIGCGHVGKDVARLMLAFGCTVLAHDIANYDEFYRETGVRPVALEDLLRQAEIVTLHLPLDRSTRNILSGERLALMPDGAILINTARGGLLDEAAAAERLRSGKLGGAAFDVLEIEPPDTCVLATLENAIVTPHIGGSTEEAILAMGRAAIEGLTAASHPSTLALKHSQESR